jgi:hypothetical protein
MRGGEVMYSTGWKLLNTLALDCRTIYIYTTGWGVLYRTEYSTVYAFMG